MTIEQWRRWFAWHPVVITVGPEEGAIVWLRHIERRATYLDWSMLPGMFYDYREIGCPHEDVSDGWAEDDHSYGD